MAEQQLQVFGFWASPFSRRVELALKLKGLDYQHIDEDLLNNPIHKKVPVLVHRGQPISESLVILEYIEETWRDNPLFPEDPYERALARFWAKYIDGKVLSAVLKAVKSKEEEIEKAVEETQEALEPLENELKSRKFFGGDRLGFVDIVGTLVAYWFPAIEEAFEIELLRSDKFPNIRKWSQQLVNHNMVKEILPQKDELVPCLKAIFQKN